MKTMNLGLSGLVATILLSAPAAWAHNHYGMAGCGLGSLVFEDEPGKIQIVAATLNEIVFPQSSAITSGTSNCYESRRDTAALFITINHASLQTDIAKGQGDTLAGLEEIYGCKNKSEFRTSLRQNYNTIYSSPSVQPEKVSEKIEGLIKSQQGNSCEIFS